MRRALVLLVAVLLSAATSAQSLEVSLSPISPTGASYVNGPPRVAALGAFRFEVSGAPVQLDGIVLTLSGSGDFEDDLTGNTGLRLYQDDGDARFDATLDTLLAAVHGDQPTVTMVLEMPLVIAPGVVDIWIVASFRSGATLMPDRRTYVAAVSAAADINCTAATVTLGSPLPVTNEVSLTPGSPGVPPTDQPRVCSTPVGRGVAFPWTMLGGVAALFAIRQFIPGAVSGQRT